MKRAQTYALVFALTLTSTAATAIAGKRDEIPVSISSRFAQGALADARASADNNQYIGCYTTEYSGTCVAIDAATEASAACTTQDPEQLAVIRSITTESAIVFSWNRDGTCRTVTVWTSSFLKPAATSGY